MKIEEEYFVRLVNNQGHVFTTPIKETDFETQALRAAMVELKNQIRAGTSPDMASIAMALPQYGTELFATNSMQYSNYHHYEGLMIEAIQTRRLYRAVNELGIRIGKGEPSSEILRDALDMLSSCRVDSGAGKASTFYDCLGDFMPILEERYKNSGALPGITTGFKRLDDLLGGFQPQVYFIGARPSQGKTALLLTMIRAAMVSGRRAVMLSLESSQHAIIQRMLSSEGNVAMTAIKTGRLDGQFNKLENACEKMKSWSGYLEFNPGGKLMDIERSCHSFVKGHGVDIIFIDYLQRITAPGRTKWEEVSAATRTITNLSRELNVPIVCMAQTSREADHEPPQISHFQHSSQIEQDADVAIVIQHKYACGCGRCGNDNTDCPERKEASYLSVLKNRDGDVDHVPVMFERDYVRFV